MAKSKKSKTTKAKPSVKVQDLEPENDPKGGFQISGSGDILKLGDGSVRTISPTTSITDGTSNTLLDANKLYNK